MLHVGSLLLLRSLRSALSRRRAPGEIIPQAACSRFGLQIGAYSAPFVQVGLAARRAAVLLGRSAAAQAAVQSQLGAETDGAVQAGTRGVRSMPASLPTCMPSLAPLPTVAHVPHRTHLLPHCLGA